MLGLESGYRLKDFFRDIAERELEIERQRQILAEIRDFEPYAAFCRINRHGDKRISNEEIWRFLQENGVVHLSERDCGTIISYFDSDLDNGLNYKEFMEVVLPCDDLYMRSVVTQRPSYDCAKTERLSFSVEQQVALLLKLEVEFHKHVAIVKSDLKRRSDWSDMRSFNSVDIHRDGFITYANMMNFLRLNGLRASEAEVIAIIRRLDIDADQKITYEEWCKTMQDNNDINLPLHQDPSSPMREDPYFRHTSPVKGVQHRDASPRRGGLSYGHSQNTAHLEESKEPRSGFNQTTSSPGKSRIMPPTYFAQSQPLRPYSPARTSNHLAIPSDSHPLRPSGGSPARQSPARATYSPRRPDSPLRQNNPHGRQATVSYGASPARTTDYHLPREPTFGFGDNHKRSSVTQSLMKNDDYKEKFAATATQLDTVRQNAFIPPTTEDENGNKQHLPQRSNLKFDEQEELIGAFKEQMRLEQELQDAKCRLAQAQDFNLMDAFQMIDKHSKGWVTGPEVHEALNELGAYPHKDEIYLVVRRYDKDSDGRMLYSDFCDAFTPHDELLHSALTKRPAYHLQNGYCRTHYFLRETRDLFLATWRTHFQVEEAAELLRKRLSRRPNFSVHDAFTTVDKDGNGYLTQREFGKLLNENGIYASERETHQLCDRYDRNKDGRITYSEFMEEMLPKTPIK